MIGVGVIGYGYWGPNLVRNFAENDGSRVVSVCDLSAQRLTAAQKRHPGVATTPDPTALIQNPAVDAVVIATPVSSHYGLVLQALRAGKHVLVEKPLADSSERSQELVEEACRRKLVLMVDHTFVYTGAVRKIKELITGGDLGEIFYYDSVRVNLGLFQHDVDVIWDLAVHDLSIIDYLFQEPVVAVSATGMAHVPGKPANIAFLTLFFNSRLVAHLHVNWLSPVKVRKTLIGASRKMIVYDDLEASEKIKIYDKGITVTGEESQDAIYKTLVGYRTGDMWCPKIDTSEALQRECSQFVACIERGDTAITDGNAGLRVVRILEAASQSLAERGRPMELPQAVTA